MGNKKKVVKKSRKIIIVLVCLLIPLGALGFGYFTKKDNVVDKQVSHTLTVDGNIGGTVVNSKETNMSGIVPGDTLDETINIKPNATTPSLLRVKIEPSWYNGDNKTDLSVSNIKFLYADNVKQDQFIDDTNDYWYKSNDGYLYYMNSVKTRKNAIKLVKGIKFLGGASDTDANSYQGKKLKITVTMDMIQCKYAPYKTKWKTTKDNTQLCNKLEALCPNANENIE